MSTLTPEQDKHAKSLFATYDKDKSGWLNEREMRLLLSVILQKSIVNPEVEKVVKEYFAKYDANNDKKISIDEFTKFYEEYLKDKVKPVGIQTGISPAMASSAPSKYRALMDAEFNAAKALFDKADKDQSGFIDAQELKTLLQELLTHEKKSDQSWALQAQMALEKADKDKNGKMEFREFIEYYREVLSIHDTKQ